MGKCVECSEEGDWLSICPDCFMKAMIECDDDDYVDDKEGEMWK